MQIVKVSQAASEWHCVRSKRCQLKLAGLLNWQHSAKTYMPRKQHEFI